MITAGRDMRVGSEPSTDEGKACSIFSKWSHCTSWSVRNLQIDPNLVKTRVIPILIPVSENAADTLVNAGIDIREYASLCTNRYRVIY